MPRNNERGDKGSRLLATVMTVLFLLQGRAPALAEDLTQALVFYTKGEYAKAYPLLGTFAAHGNAVAQEILGRMYAEGQGVEPDEPSAFKWFLKAAMQGRTDAQFQAAVRYRDGLGTERNGKLALHWFNTAGERGAPHAFSALGALYRGHADVPPDPAAALESFRRGAQSDHFESMFNIGLIYARGEGVSKDEFEAYKWFERAYAAGLEEERERVEIARTMLAQQLTSAQIWAAKVEAADWFTDKAIQ
jgi:localization factor PodJL